MTVPLYRQDGLLAGARRASAEYRDFVEKYCDGNTPTKPQEALIKVFLNGQDRFAIMGAGRGAGKTTVLEWIGEAVKDKIANREIEDPWQMNR